MSAAYQQALQSLAAIRARLADPALSNADRDALLEEFGAALALLARQDHRLDTVAAARRVQELDRQLHDRAPAERNEIIALRTGFSRTRIYELRAIRLRPDGSAV